MSCFESAAYLWNTPECLFGLLTLMAAVVAGLWKFTTWANREISEWNTFSIFFTDGGSPGARILYWGDDYPIPIAQQSFHWFKIICNRGLNLSSFNVQFFPVEETSKRSNHRPANSDIIYICDLWAPPEVMLHGSTYVQTNIPVGGRGGIRGTFSPPYIVGSGTELYFKIRICTEKPWYGKIRFQGLDQENNTRDTCHLVKVS